MAVIMENRRGFTLIELLVVISVISIIIGVVIPRFKGMQDEANKTKAKAELKTLQTAFLTDLALAGFAQPVP